MATFDTKAIRNLALLGHGACGKTSLAEAMLYLSGKTDRLGKVTDGNTVCDFDPEEQKRGFSISASLAHVVWKDIKINILDTPGYPDFDGEVRQALRVAGSAVIVVDGKSGIEVGTELAFNAACDAGVPRVFFVNKCDDPDYQFAKSFYELRDKFGTTLCPVFIPCNVGNSVAMIDLISNKAYTYDNSGKRSEIPMSEEMNNMVNQYKDAFNEAIASTSDELMEKYFSGEEITREEATLALHEGIIDGSITPVYCGSATKMWGVIAMMDAVAESFPRFTAKKVEKLSSGEDIAIDVAGDPAIFVFKTVADPFVGQMSYFKVMSGTIKQDMVLKNATTGTSEKLAHFYTMIGKKQTEVDELCCGDIGMIAKLSDTKTNDTLSLGGSVVYSRIAYPTPYMTQAILPLTAKDESKMSQSIAKMLEEDLTLRYENNKETSQILISGLGDTHLAVLIARMESRFGVKVKLEEPKIAYRERITKRVDVEGKHKKQTGGSGQYGHVKVRFAPAEDEGLTFTVSVVGGAVPKNFYPAVEKGLQDAMAKGKMGYPLVQLAADLYDGSYHDVDSDELSFRLAAQLAYKQCLEQAAPVLLEPVGNLDITVPEALVGTVMGDLNKRRGSVMGMDHAEGRKGYTVVHAIVPKAEIVNYPIDLRAMTKGFGSFEFSVTGYEVVPGNLTAKIAAAQKN
ncbi:MAG: elongation factor G [Ruminococcaceae bacterium]|nr:elongation factor G [Oscillospiraceae bacterium]